MWKKFWRKIKCGFGICDLRESGMGLTGYSLKCYYCGRLEWRRWDN